MKCKREGCNKEAKDGKDYCGVVCSRIDNEKSYNKIVKSRGGKVKTIKRKNRAPNKDLNSKRIYENYKYEKDGVSYRGKTVCANFNNEKIECVVCYEQGLYFGKTCRNGGEDL